MINKEELRDNLRVLLFMEPEGLFYEGEMKEIRPPDVYGVVIDNQRGNRPHIYPQEEILKLAVSLPFEGTSNPNFKKGFLLFYAYRKTMLVSVW